VQQLGSSRRAVAIILLWAVMLAGCGSDPLSPIPASVAVHPEHQWAGATLVLELAGVEAQGSRLGVYANGLPLEVEHWDGHQAIVRVPETATGPLDLEVDYEGQKLPAGQVEIYGFSRYVEYPSRLQWFIQEYPVDYGVSVVSPYSVPYRVSGEWDAGSFSWIHLSTGVSREFDVDHSPGDNCHGVGLLLNPPAVVTCPSHDTTHVWRIEATRLVDHGPGIIPGAYRWFGQVSRDFWIEIWPHWGYMRRMADGARVPSVEFRVEDSYGVEVLESQALLTIESYSYNAPVISTETGEVIYKLGPEVSEPPIYGVLGAAADEGRGRFYIAAGGLIASIEARTGKVLNYRELGPFRNQFPLEHASGPDVLLVLDMVVRKLLILDPETLGDLGRIDLDAVMPRCAYGKKVVADPDANMAYLVFADACSCDGVWIRGTPVVEISLPLPGVVPRASTTPYPAETPPTQTRSGFRAVPGSTAYPTPHQRLPVRPGSRSCPSDCP